MTKSELIVKGMTCMGCVGNVKKVLQALPGVKEVDIVLQVGKVTVQHDPDKTDIEAMKTSIEEAGYEVD